MPAVTESIGEGNGRRQKATANWATKPKIRPGMTQSRPLNEGEGDDRSPRPALAQIARPNVAMVTGFPSAMSRQLVRRGAAVEHQANRATAEEHDYACGRGSMSDDRETPEVLVHAVVARSDRATMSLPSR